MQSRCLLWFAWKSVPLWYLKQQSISLLSYTIVVICLKISTFVVSKTTSPIYLIINTLLWFAWKSVPLWYLKQHRNKWVVLRMVVICLKISTFVVSKTTVMTLTCSDYSLWFAWKSVPLWYLKQLLVVYLLVDMCCDLLENQYLCGI